MQIFLTDLRYALRLLTRAPGFTLLVVLVIALGIGANSAIFTLVDQTVVRSLPYADSDRLAMLCEDFSTFGSPISRVSPATYLDWRRRNQVFGQVAAFGAVSSDFSGGGPPELVQGARVTSNLIPMLGVAPAMGRTFGVGEEGPGIREVVLSNRLWQRRFSGERDLVGKPILMNEEKYTVIGVKGSISPTVKLIIGFPSACHRS